MQGVALGLRVRRDAVEARSLFLLASDRLNRLMAAGEAPGGDEEGDRGGLRWRIEREPFDPAGEDVPESIPLRIVVEAGSGRAWEIVTLMPPAAEDE